MCHFSYDLLVNRQHLLPADFVPKGLVQPDIPFSAPNDSPRRFLESHTALAAEKLFHHAAQEQISLCGISGYRSYQRQLQLFSSANNQSYVAPAGASEHQTGLALDISSSSVSYELTEEFFATLEGKWLNKNAPLFGFIIRYPKGKENITGYAWEPWHIRYVTKSLSLYLTLTGLTLEEYHARSAIVPSADP